MKVTPSLVAWKTGGWNDERNDSLETEPQHLGVRYNLKKLGVIRRKNREMANQNDEMAYQT